MNIKEGLKNYIEGFKKTKYTYSLFVLGMLLFLFDTELQKSLMTLAKHISLPYYFGIIISVSLIMFFSMKKAIRKGKHFLRDFLEPNFLKKGFLSKVIYGFYALSFGVYMGFLALILSSFLMTRIGG